jgi:hypothetical protein
VIAFLFAALLAGQDADLSAVRAAGEAQIAQWLELVNAGKIDEAAAMVVGNAHYSEFDSKVDRSLPPKAFLTWIRTCQPGMLFNVEATPMPDGEVGRMFDMICPARAAGEGKASDATIEIMFNFGSKGEGIRI